MPARIYGHMFAAIIALSMLGSHASTPQQAAVRVVSFGLKTPATVRRTNVAGRYASVLTSGGRMEGWNVTAPILVERFSFGWQPVDVLNDRCSLEGRNLGPRVNALLLSGMPRPQGDRRCRGALTDSGPQADVETVRSMMRGPIVPAVVVSGDWALGHWYGAGGGEALYRKREGRWALITRGGGAMGVDEMRRFGVPREDWCRFGIYNAACP